jgi:transcriptional regulator with XRE-family HTH domain
MTQHLELNLEPGRRLAVLRSLRGFSQTALARELGTVSSVVNRTESGLRPSAAFKRRIVEYFGADPWGDDPITIVLPGGGGR